MKKILNFFKKSPFIAITTVLIGLFILTILFKGWVIIQEIFFPSSLKNGFMETPVFNQIHINSGISNAKQWIKFNEDILKKTEDKVLLIFDWDEKIPDEKLPLLSKIKAENGIYYFYGNTKDSFKKEMLNDFLLSNWLKNLFIVTCNYITDISCWIKQKEIPYSKAYMGLSDDFIVHQLDYYSILWPINNIWLQRNWEIYPVHNPIHR